MRNFVTGFVVMAFELAGSRVLGPYFGSSVFVWTSLIGIIMGCLSLGYWLGGVLSVYRNEYWLLAAILAVTAFFILVTSFNNMYVLDRVLKYIPGVQFQVVFSTLECGTRLNTRM